MLDLFFVHAEDAIHYNRKEDDEHRKRYHRVNAYACDLFEVGGEFHVRFYLLVTEFTLTSVPSLCR